MSDTSNLSVSLDLAQIELFLDEPISTELMKQLERGAQLPGMQRIAAMPDLHIGRDLPIGAVYSSSQIYPHVVGIDIGCGMRLSRIEKPPNKFSLKASMHDYLYAMGRPLEDLSPYEHLVNGAPEKFNHSLGTIGGGNHFAELLEVHVMGETASQHGISKKSLYTLVHSGSRAFGQAVATATPSFHIQQGIVPGSEEARDYLAQHNIAVQWAKINRQIISERFAEALSLPTPHLIVDISHNFVTPFSTREEPSYLHRKGAAPSDCGLVVIPGSRGDYSYVVEPVNPEHQIGNLFSFAHGAGRRMSRGDAKAKLKDRFKKEDLLKIKNDKGIQSDVICGSTDLLWEEAPEAYKPITKVIKSLEDRELLRVVAILKPRLTCKPGGHSDDE